MKLNNPPEFTALIGLDWGDKSHAIALEPAGGPTETSTLEHSAESLHQWLDQLEQRFGARQVAIAIEPDQGAMDFLPQCPRLVDVQAAKPATLKSFYHRHNVRRPQFIQKRLDRVRSARLLTRDAAVIEVSVSVVQLLVAELRVLVEHITGFESAIAQDFARHPEKTFFSELPGAGPTLAPRLLAAFGTLREQYPEVACMQRYFGVAPVTEKSGSRAWIHWRWNAPTFTRQTLVEWAGQTIVFCPWAKAYYERQRAKGSAHHAILRALAFKWLRVLWRCWQKRQPYNQEQFLRQLEKRRSPIAARARQLALEMAA